MVSAGTSGPLLLRATQRMTQELVGESLSMNATGDGTGQRIALYRSIELLPMLWAQFPCAFASFAMLAPALPALLCSAPSGKAIYNPSIISVQYLLVYSAVSRGPVCCHI